MSNNILKKILSFFSKEKDNNLRPIPNHLKNIFKEIGCKNSEFEVIGNIICTCGCENFTIKIVGDDTDYKHEKVIKTCEIDEGYFLIVKVECNSCKEEHLIFDNDYHGWNGFVCGGDNKDIKRPKSTNWKCDSCEKTNHEMTVKINSEGKLDFEDEAGENFDSNDWAEGFSWITISVDCKTCNQKNEEWISYETM